MLITVAVYRTRQQETAKQHTWLQMIVMIVTSILAVSCRSANNWLTTDTRLQEINKQMISASR